MSEHVGTIALILGMLFVTFYAIVFLGASYDAYKHDESFMVIGFGGIGFIVCVGLDYVMFRAF